MSDKYLIYGYKFAGDHPHAGEWCYVGQTSRALHLRHNGHLRDDLAIDYFLRDYPAHWSGPHIILDNISHESVAELEEHFANHYDTWQPRGFNGAAGSVLSQDTRNKMSARKIGVKRPPDVCRNIAASKTGDKNYWFGKRHSPETLEIMSAAQAGENAYWFGKKQPAEMVAKRVAKNTGQRRTVEQSRRMSQAQVLRRARERAEKEAQNALS